MREERRVVRQYRLQKFVRLLSGRYDIDVTLPKEKIEMFKRSRFDKNKVPYYGFSDSEKNIFINPKINRDPYENLIQQKAVSLHELGHVLYTDGKLWLDSGVNHFLCNIIEDGRVEEAISRDFPKARKYFYYLNEKIGKEGLINTPFPSTEMLLSDFMLRFAKLTTGMPPPDIKNINKLKKKLKEDYDFFYDKTLKAVGATTEEEAINYTREIEEKWVKLFGNKKSLPSLFQTPFSSISQKQNKRGKAKPMPPQMPRNKNEKEEQLKQKMKQQSGDPNTTEKDSKNAKESDVAKKLSKDAEAKGKKEGEGKGHEKDDTKDKSIKDIHDELKKEAKEDLEKETKAEYGQETEEIKKGTINGKFNDYIGIKEIEPEKEEQIYTQPLDALANKIHHKFKIIAQTGKSWKRNQKRGKIDSSKLYRVHTSKNESPRVFKSQKPKDKTDISAIILLDISGSMGNIAKTAIESCYVIAKALELGKFNCEIVGFGHGRGSLLGIKSFNQTIKYAKNNFCPMAFGGTPLYPALKGAQSSLSHVDSKRKVIFVITDGEPNEGGGPEECRIKIKEIEKEGINVVGLLINNADSEKIFNRKRQFRIDDVREIPVKMTIIIKSILLAIRREDN